MIVNGEGNEVRDPWPRRLYLTVKRYPLPAIAFGLVLTSCILSAVAGVAAYGAQREADVAQDQLAASNERALRRECELSNLARADARELARRATLDGGESLIEAVVDPSDSELQAIVAVYRAILSDRMQAIVNEHAIDDRDCEAEAVARAAER